MIGEPNDQPNQQLLYPTVYYAQMETTVVTKPHELYGKRWSRWPSTRERTGKLYAKRAWLTHSIWLRAYS